MKAVIFWFIATPFNSIAFSIEVISMGKKPFWAARPNIIIFADTVSPTKASAKLEISIKLILSLLICISRCFFNNWSSTTLPMWTPATPRGSTLPLTIALVFLLFNVLVIEGETETTASQPKSRFAVSFGNRADLV